jgi:hypothetical protein
MRRAILGALIALLLAAGPAWGAAGTITWSTAKWQEPGTRKVGKVYTVTLTSGSAGETISGASAAAIHGWLVRVVTDPDDTLFPTDNWDLTIGDGNVSDILHGGGANRDTTAVTAEDAIIFGADASTIMGMVRVDSALTVGGTTMGTSKVAVVKLYTVE